MEHSTFKVQKIKGKKRTKINEIKHEIKMNRKTTEIEYIIEK